MQDALTLLAAIAASTKTGCERNLSSQVIRLQVVKIFSDEIGWSKPQIHINGELAHRVSMEVVLIILDLIENLVGVLIRL